MPTRLCMERSCRSPATWKGRCAAHNARYTRQHRERTPPRPIYRTKRWAIIRDRVLAEQPICAICNSSLSEHVHHVVDIADGGDEWARENLVGACAPCHASVTMTGRY